MLSLSLVAPVIHAGGLDAVDDKIKLDPIIIPFFPVFGSIDPSSATVLTWITFIVGVLIVLVIIFWIARILFAGLEAIRSAGDAEKLQEAFKKIQSNLVGIGITFLVPIVLSVIGFVLGIGTIFNWPKMFSACDDAQYDYYFRAYFNAPPGQDPVDFANGVCGVNSAN